MIHSSCIWCCGLWQNVVLMQRNRKIPITALTQSTAESADHCGKCEWAFKDDSHELGLTHAATVEGVLQKIRENSYLCYNASVSCSRMNQLQFKWMSLKYQSYRKYKWDHIPDILFLSSHLIPLNGTQPWASPWSANINAHMPFVSMCMVPEHALCLLKKNMFYYTLDGNRIGTC